MIEFLGIVLFLLCVRAGAMFYHLVRNTSREKRQRPVVRAKEAIGYFNNKRKEYMWPDGLKQKSKEGYEECMAILCLLESFPENERTLTHEMIDGALGTSMEAYKERVDAAWAKGYRHPRLQGE